MCNECLSGVCLCAFCSFFDKERKFRFMHFCFGFLLVLCLSTAFMFLCFDNIEIILTNFLFSNPFKSFTQIERLISFNLRLKNSFSYCDRFSNFSLIRCFTLENLPFFDDFIGLFNSINLKLNFEFMRVSGFKARILCPTIKKCVINTF